MKRVLIVAEGKIARIFVEYLLEKYFSNNHYIIVSRDSRIAELKYSTSFEFHHFDPTSAYRLTPLLSDKIDDVFIIVSNPKERDEICLLVREISSEIPITMSIESRAEAREEILNDAKIDLVSMSYITARALVGKMPNIPLVARGFGLNKGEVMQIHIPFGSAYAFISIGSIQQKSWRIVGIYRKNDFLIATPSMIIQPNDSILVVGDPTALNNIYKKITSSASSFPAPFGIDIYAYVDFRTLGTKDIDNLVDDALWLHNNLKNHRLIMRIFNPNNIEKLNAIKHIRANDIAVHINYDTKSPLQQFQEDCLQKIGLAIISPSMLSTRTARRIFYRANTPILKVGKSVRLRDTKSALIVSSSGFAHNMSYSVMDFASQLNLAVKLYEFEIDEDYDMSLAAHYQSIGRIFNKTIDVERTKSKNPIVWLYQHNEPLVQFIPFEIDILKPKMLWFWDKNVNCLSLNIDKNPQILMPL